MGSKVGHLQSASLLFAFPEIRDRWAPVEELTMSPPFALRNRSDNRNRVNSQSLSIVNPSRELSWQPKWGKVPSEWRTGRHIHKKAPWCQKSGQLQPIMSLVPPRSLHFEIHLGCGVRMHPRGGPQGSSGVEKETRQLAWRKTKTWENCLINALTASLLGSSSLGRMTTPFLSRRASLPSFCLN